MPVDPVHTRILAPHLRAPHPHPQYALAVDTNAALAVMPSAGEVAELSGRVDDLESAVDLIPGETTEAVENGRVSVKLNDIPIMSGLKTLHLRGQMINAYESTIGEATVVINPPNVPAYLHTQSVPATDWVITHNLGRIPSAVQVTDSAGSVCLGQVDHTTADTTVCRFGAAFAGTARIL